MNEKRSQSVIVALLAAMLIPRIQKWTGVTLTLDDIACLMAAAVASWHGICAVIERYFPPPMPHALEIGLPFVQPSPKENPK